VARAVAVHRRVWPKMTIDVETRGREAQFEELRAGRLDIGLAAMPFAGTGLRVEPVMDADVVCLLHTDHPLARRAALTPADLADEALVLSRPGSIIRHRLDDIFRQAGVVQRVAAIVDSTPVAIALVGLGTGIGVMHAFPQDALPPNVVTRRFRPRIPFTYAMITQDDDTRSAAIAPVRRDAPHRRPHPPPRPPPQPPGALTAAHKSPPPRKTRHLPRLTGEARIHPLRDAGRGRRVP
jgi:DNA-binding transcriptional LysR family regulator